MTFLKAVILLDVMEVIPSDDNGPLHLVALHNPCQDPSPNTNVSSEWTFLVYVSAFNSLQNYHKIDYVQEMLYHWKLFQ